MHFTKKKLPKKSLKDLQRMRIDKFRPFEFLLGPAYVFLKENEKFVAIKAPLDFFIENELSHLLKLKYLYFPKSTGVFFSFHEAGKNVRELLTWKKSLKSIPKVELGPSPFEISHLILNVIGPLWWNYSRKQMAVEPFLITIFVNALCDPFSKDKLLEVRENDPQDLDRALFRSSWIVFLALHLGYNNLKFLNRLRLRVFDENLKGSTIVSNRSELDELVNLSYLCLKDENVKRLSANFFYDRSGKSCTKAHLTSSKNSNRTRQ